MCEHKNTYLEENVGWDIDTEGEEHQHLERCKDCGNNRLVIDRYSFIENKSIRFELDWDDLVYF